MELTQEIAALQTNLVALEKRGGKIKLANCGGRVCIDVTSKEPGSWTRKEGELTIPLAIPRGY